MTRACQPTPGTNGFRSPQRVDTAGREPWQAFSGYARINPGRECLSAHASPTPQGMGGPSCQGCACCSGGTVSRVALAPAGIR